ncbi:MAG TPA: aminoglycoside phosphotransferase family protein [Nitriliruptorales bacterium]
MSGYLAYHLAQDLTPGTNLKGAQAPPAWLFLLPSPAIGLLATAGEVARELVEELAPYADRVESIDASRPASGDLLVVGPGLADGRVRTLVDGHPEASVVLLPGTSLAGIEADVRRLDAVPTSRGPHPSGPVEGSGTGGSRCAVAVPPDARTPTPAARLVRRALRVVRPSRLVLGAGLRGDLGPVAAPPERGDAVVLLPRSIATHGPPAYVREVGGFDGAGWTLVPARGYVSQKLVFLPPPGGDTVVKVARTELAARRLANEADLLEYVHHELPEHAGIPRVRGRRALGPALAVAESLVEGSPIRGAADVGPASGTLRAALDTLHRLATTTARAPAPDAGAALGELVGRFASEHGDDHVVDQLRRDVETVIRAQVPAVVLHGDAGPQNLLVVGDQRIGLLDWENAERLGPPVWDLTYLLLTSVELELERGSRRAPGSRVADRLFGHGPWRTLLDSELARAGSELGFAAEAGPALVRLFLAYLARRDLPRLDPEAVTVGPRARILVAAVERYG